MAQCVAHREPNSWQMLTSIKKKPFTAPTMCTTHVECLKWSAGTLLLKVSCLNEDPTRGRRGRRGDRCTAPGCSCCFVSWDDVHRRVKWIEGKSKTGLGMELREQRQACPALKGAVLVAETVRLHFPTSAFSAPDKIALTVTPRPEEEGSYKSPQPWPICF